MAQTDQTYADQYNWFKLVYGYVQQSLTSDYGYKGIMFWRWGNVDTTASTGGFDEAATISECSLMPLQRAVRIGWRAHFTAQPALAPLMRQPP